MTENVLLEPIRQKTALDTRKPLRRNGVGSVKADPLATIDAAPDDRPFVVAQLGQSLDGRIATLTGESRWINGDAALDHLHRLRAHVDAVVVGVGTAQRMTRVSRCGGRPGETPPGWSLIPADVCRHARSVSPRMARDGLWSAAMKGRPPVGSRRSCSSAQDRFSVRTRSLPVSTRQVSESFSSKAARGQFPRLSMPVRSTGCMCSSRR